MRSRIRILIAVAACLLAVFVLPRSSEAGGSGGETLSVQVAVLVGQALADRIECAAPPAGSGIDTSRSLRLRPSFQTGPAPQGAPPTTTSSAQGGVPAPKPVYANQSGQPFQPARIMKVVQYGLQLTFYEHVMRVATQDFTRSQLEGKFWPEYFDSVNKPLTWNDKDGWEVNYLGHAIHGGAFTRIWLDQRERKATTAAEYFKSYGRAFLYTAAFSMQYEIGPMSEASIGNVGMNPEDVGWVDHIWTPIGGILWTMAEDAIDKYALTYIDKRVPFKMARVAARLILNPSRMLANIGQNRTPWSRSDRTLSGEPIRR